MGSWICFWDSIQIFQTDTKLRSTSLHKEEGGESIARFLRCPKNRWGGDTLGPEKEQSEVRENKNATMSWKQRDKRALGYVNPITAEAERILWLVQCSEDHCWWKELFSWGVGFKWKDREKIWSLGAQPTLFRELPSRRAEKWGQDWRSMSGEKTC